VAQARGDAGLIERIADLQYRLLDRVRHRAAFDVARREGTAHDFEGLRSARQCLVVTFKRSGEPVPTPVNFGVAEDGKLYFRAEPRSAKVRRIRRDSHVRVCACNFRGKPTGPMVEGRARVVSEPEAERAESVVASNWNAGMKVVERGLDRLPLEMVYVEVQPKVTGDDRESA
jgi:PPOX class probable F420-dependent enzyme